MRHLFLKTTNHFRDRALGINRTCHIGCPRLFYFHNRLHLGEIYYESKKVVRHQLSFIGYFVLRVSVRVPQDYKRASIKGPQEDLKVTLAEILVVVTNHHPLVWQGTSFDCVGFLNIDVTLSVVYVHQNVHLDSHATRLL